VTFCGFEKPLFLMVFCLTNVVVFFVVRIVTILSTVLQQGMGSTERGTGAAGDGGRW